MFKSFSLAALGPVLVTLLSGAGFPFQAAANTAVGRALGHPFWGALTSLTVSGLSMLPLLLMFRVSAPNVAHAVQGPWWLWIGGFIGAFYVAWSTIATPMLGVGGLLVCIVTGQMVAAVLCDHYGWMGLAVRPINSAKLVGILLILAGAWLVLSNRDAVPR